MLFRSFRDLPNSEVEAIKKQLGDKVVVQQTPFVIHFDIAMNNTVKPFTDVRVRKALTLGIDRYTGGKVLYALTGLRDVGALTRPAGHGVGDVAGRAREVPWLLAGRGEEPGRGQTAPGRGGLPERVRSEERRVGKECRL